MHFLNYSIKEIMHHLTLKLCYALESISMQTQTINYQTKRHKIGATLSIMSNEFAYLAMTSIDCDCNPNSEN